MGTRQTSTKRDGKPFQADLCLACSTRVTARDQFCAWRGPMDEAVLRALAYADVFGHPLDRAELARYCPLQPTPGVSVDASIERMLRRGCIEAADRYIFFVGRGKSVVARRRREAHSLAAWHEARLWGRAIWMLPFVRMVAVTGSLAACSMEPGQDIDYLVVVEPRRLWLTRTLCFPLWAVARLAGTRICPNYMLTTETLEFGDRDLYVARELIQMVPLYGRDIADRLWTLNQWSRAYLPNAVLAVEHARDPGPAVARHAKRAAERLLTVARIHRLEGPLHVVLARALEFSCRWFLRGPGGREKTWRVRRQSVRGTGAGALMPETRLSPALCKFHAYSHRDWILGRYEARLVSLGQEGGTKPRAADGYGTEPALAALGAQHLTT